MDKQPCKKHVRKFWSVAANQDFGNYGVLHWVYEYAHLRTRTLPFFSIICLAQLKSTTAG